MEISSFTPTCNFVTSILGASANKVFFPRRYDANDRYEKKVVSICVIFVSAVSVCVVSNDFLKTCHLCKWGLGALGLTGATLRPGFAEATICIISVLDLRGKQGRSTASLAHWGCFSSWSGWREARRGRRKSESKSRYKTRQSNSRLEGMVAVHN